MKQELNHHSAALLPYYVSATGTLHFVFERKDPKFRAPYFDRGLNFLGGNSLPQDVSTLDLLHRELSEEFWHIDEPQESLNALLGQAFIDEHPDVVDRFSVHDVNKIQEISTCILRDAVYAGTYERRIPPPIMKTELVHTGSIYVKRLDALEFKLIEDLLSQYGNKITPDNLRWGSTVEIATLEDINQHAQKFAWGYCGLLNDLLQRGFFPSDERVLRPLSLITGDRIASLDTLVNPTKEDIESLGYQFNPKNW